jgi:hypothetical protein
VIEWKVLHYNTTIIRYTISYHINQSSVFRTALPGRRILTSERLTSPLTSYCRRTLTGRSLSQLSNKLLSHFHTLESITHTYTVWYFRVIPLRQPFAN